MFLPGESQGQGSLVGCHLWGRIELDMTEVTQQQQHLCVSDLLLMAGPCEQQRSSGVLLSPPSQSPCVLRRVLASCAEALPVAVN